MAVPGAWPLAVCLSILVLQCEDWLGVSAPTECFPDRYELKPKVMEEWTPTPNYRLRATTTFLDATGCNRCLGTFIKPEYVLSTVYCADSVGVNPIVRFGSSGQKAVQVKEVLLPPLGITNIPSDQGWALLKSSSTCETSRVQETVIHPGYIHWVLRQGYDAAILTPRMPVHSVWLRDSFPGWTTTLLVGSVLIGLHTHRPMEFTSRLQGRAPHRPRVSSPKKRPSNRQSQAVVASLLTMMTAHACAADFISVSGPTALVQQTDWITPPQDRFAYVVIISGMDGRHLCQAALITRRDAITSAECAIMAGPNPSASTQWQGKMEVARIEKTAMHRSVAGQQQTRHHDVAVMRLHHPLDVPLPTLAAQGSGVLPNSTVSIFRSSSPEGLEVASFALMQAAGNATPGKSKTPAECGPMIVSKDADVDGGRDVVLGVACLENLPIGSSALRWTTVGETRIWIERVASPLQESREKRDHTIAFGVSMLALGFSVVCDHVSEMYQTGFALFLFTGLGAGAWWFEDQRALLAMEDRIAIFIALLAISIKMLYNMLPARFRGESSSGSDACNEVAASLLK